MESEIIKTFFKSELWSIILDFFITSLVIAIVNSLLIETVKNAYKSIKRIDSPKILNWVLSILISFVMSFIFVFVFVFQSDLGIAILYSFLVSIFSFTLAVILYKVFVKSVLLFGDGLALKAKRFKSDAELEFVNSRNAVLKAKVLTRELVESKKIDEGLNDETDNFSS